MLHRDQSARLGELCSRSLPLIRRENAEIAVRLQELRTGHPVAVQLMIQTLYVVI